ncbi:hypothetical protein BBJ28_00019029 [Nothophytophthora sp. Chile5]|nr:hypothetical protein BBJ28_00019029 [Nothophytophthora sp. Chile5]
MRGSPSPSDDFSASSSGLRPFSTSQGMSSRLSQDSSSQSSAQRGERADGAFTLFLRVHSARNLAALTQGSYCKLYVGDSPLVGGFGQSKSIMNLLASDRKHAVKVEATYRSFHTKVQFALQKEHPEWNEKFEVNVLHPATEILTIRVKSQVMLYSPAIGACAIHLRHLTLGETVDQWFPLYKNDKPAGHIRLQLLLEANASEAALQMPRESSMKSMTMQRLIQEHREQQDARKLELQAQQQEQWQRVKEEEVEQVELGREGRWRELSKRRDETELQSSLTQEEKGGGCDEVAASDDGAILRRRNFDFAVEEATASKSISELSLHEAKKDSPKFVSTLPADEADDGVSPYDAVFDSSNKEMRRMGTKRLSVEDLNQVVQDALPSSDSSESTSSEEERERLRRERKHRKEKKSRRRKHKHHSRRQFSSEDEYSQSGSDSSTEYRRAYGKSNSREEKRRVHKSSHSSMSSKSRGSNQSSNDKPRRGKEKFREATIKVIADKRRRFSAMDSMPEFEEQPRGKPRRDTDASMSLTYPSSPSEEEESSSEEERRPPSYASLHSIDNTPPPTTRQQNPDDIDDIRSGAAQGWGDADDVVSMMYNDASAATSSRTLTHGDADVGDSVAHGFGEAGVPAVGEYLAKTSAEGDNENLTRSFYF